MVVYFINSKFLQFYKILYSKAIITMNKLASLFSLENKNVVITGAAGGLGSQFALTLAEMGANVFMLDKAEDNLGKAAAEAKKLGRSVNTLLVDLTNPNMIQNALDQLFQFNLPIDILINNAGINGFAPVKSANFQEALKNSDAIYEVDLRANWLLSHSIAQDMIKRKIAGSIINVSSISGDRAPGLNVIYSSIKAAIIQLTRSLALELAPYRIRVNGILPGVINTPLVKEQIDASKEAYLMGKIPLKFIAEPKELDAIVLLLASNAASSYMTGSLITVDGGISISPQWK